MYNGGMSQAEICRATGMEKKTVRRFLRAGVFPERSRPRRRPAQLDHFEPYPRWRWGEGCHNATQLWREIKDEGYPGGRGMVAQFISTLRAKGTKYFRDSASRSRPTKLISPKAIAMLLTKPQESLGPTDHGFQRCRQMSASRKTKHTDPMRVYMPINSMGPTSPNAFCASSKAAGSPADRQQPQAQLRTFCLLNGVVNK
jgi:hypothetical protein